MEDGQDYTKAIQDSLEEAKASNTPVKLTLTGVALTINPGDDFICILDTYRRGRKQLARVHDRPE